MNFEDENLGFNAKEDQEVYCFQLLWKLIQDESKMSDILILNAIEKFSKIIGLRTSNAILDTIQEEYLLRCLDNIKNQKSSC